ncbi:hypothetical protein GCM10010331_23120 [Streptomyces xanthochromogenes]|nr:hypothetical protein GCM10010331_23120 [Streptomyces xanthochromogenes]
MNAYRGKDEEHQPETCRDLVMVVEGEVHDANAENGSEHDEQWFADPEGQETEKEAEHLVISP